MNYSNFIQNNFKRINLMLLVALLSFIANTFPAHAVTETIQYNNDNTRQITNVTYDDGAGVTSIYDTSGNRRSKTLDLQGTSNNPPSAPSNTSPSDTAQDVDLTASLSWTTSTDPDTGDEVVYDIYLGTTSPPPLYRNGYSSTNLTTLPLDSFTTYYWKVVARDNHNAATEGQEWSFTTIYVPILPTADPGGFYNEVEGQPVTLNGSRSTDPDGPVNLYEWDIDNNGTYDYSTSLSTQIHPYAQQGTYTVSGTGPFVTSAVKPADGEVSFTVITAVSVSIEPSLSFSASNTVNVPLWTYVCCLLGK